MLLRAPSNLALNDSRDGASTTSLGNLFQCFTLPSNKVIAPCPTATSPPDNIFPIFPIGPFKYWKAVITSPAAFSSPGWTAPTLSAFPHRRGSVTTTARVLLGWSSLSFAMGTAQQKAARCLYQSCPVNQDNLTRLVNLGPPRNLGRAGGNTKQKVYTELGKWELFLTNLILTAGRATLQTPSKHLTST